MRWLALLLPMALAACNENLAHAQPPMDRFFYPAGLVLTPVLDGNTLMPVAGGNQALLVASSNFDLRYDQVEGATVLSVDPAGSIGQPDGTLVKLGPGAQMGSFAGPLAIADRTSCPSLGGRAVAFSASRFNSKLYRFPVEADGSVAPCQATKLCEFGLEPDLSDPAALGVACRADGKRQSLFVGYLRTPWLGPIAAGTAWISEFDLANLGATPRTFALAPGPVADMAYDALTDRLYAVGRFAGLYAPLFILDLPPCSSADKADPDAPCPGPSLQTVDLYSALAGAELVGIALSNPQVDPANPQQNMPRRAYIAVRVYNEGYAAAIRARPSFDVGGAILVVDLDEDVIGQPLARVRSVVPIGIGAGSIKVLPVRPGLADLVVVPSSGDGTIQVYDDEVGAVVRVVSLDPATGAPEAGHVPYQTAVEDRGTEALVYIASFRDWTVSALRVPLADPTSADLVRDASGKPLRIGSPQP